MTFEEKVEAYNQQIDQTSTWILGQMKIANDRWEIPWPAPDPKNYPKTQELNRVGR